MTSKTAKKPPRKNTPRRPARRRTAADVTTPPPSTNEIDVVYFEEVEGPPKGEYISESELRRKYGF